MFDFEYHLKVLPELPGVYIMKNGLGEVIYVGKAKILKNRVRQYFQNNSNHTEKVKAMVKNIAEFEYVVTDSEVEALILECNLIKKYRPKYNILLKDDKYYPFIKITINEDFPRVFISRNYVKDNNKYFGPYPDYSAVYETMNLIKKIYPLRTCKKSIVVDGKSTKECLNYHIKQCSGPCAKYITKEDYDKMIEDISSLLQGKDTKILKSLKEEMKEASENLEFERAAALRDKVFSIEKINERQKMLNGNIDDEDYIDIYSDEKDSCVQVFFVRQGKVSGREHYILENTAEENIGVIISEFMQEFYGGTPYLPKNIYVRHCEDLELMEKWLSTKKGSKVSIKIPQKGEKKAMIEMVQNNAKITMEKFKIKILSEKALYSETLEEFSRILDLEEVPHRIEAYDISNIQGVDSVGSMVVFENGKPKNSDYRRFKIKTVVGSDDYSSMKEILERRFSRGLEEIKKIQESNISFTDGKFSSFPDLILMDGGKGQVNIALEVLKSFNINIPVCGMVKDDTHSTRGLIYDNRELLIPKNSKVIKLITRIQDEVHRFAITYHRTLRDKRVLHSLLDDIPNVGERRRKALLVKFGDIEKIKKASIDELLKTDSIDRKTAESIYKYFHGNKK